MQSNPSEAEALEKRVAEAALGAEPTVLVLGGATAAEARKLLDELRARTAGRALHVVVPVSTGPALSESGSIVPVSATDALTTTLATRAGAAALLDPLIRGAAAFVLGRELPALARSLEPTSLDAATPDLALLIRRRFVPAFHAQAPEVAIELLAALVRARCGGPEDAPELATVARELGPAAFVAAVGQLAQRGQVAVVLAFEAALERPAATAAHALEAISAPGFVLVLPALRELWAAEQVLLSESERGRLVALSLPAPEAPAASVPGAAVAQPVAALSPGPAAEPPPTGTLTPSGRILSPRERVRARRTGSGSGEVERAPTPGDGNPALAKTPASALAALPTARAPGSGSGLRGPGSGVRPPGPKSPSGRRPSDEGRIAASRAGSRQPPAGATRVSRLRVLALAATPITALAAILTLGRGDPEADRGRGPQLPAVAVTAGQVPAPSPSNSPPSGARPGVPSVPRPRAPGPAASPTSWTPADPFADAHTSAEVAAVLERDLPLSLTLESRTALLERAMPRLDPEARSRVLFKVLDAPIGKPSEARSLRRYAIERLVPLTELPAVSARICELLDPASARDERLCTLRAIALGPPRLPPDLHDKLASISGGQRDDGSIVSQARAILEAADLAPEAAPQAPAPGAPHASPSQ